MVLDNMAMFRKQPASIPWHLKITGGTAQIDQSVTPGLQFTWPPTARQASLSASRGITVNWNLLPVQNDEQLATLRQHYQAWTKDESFAAHFEQGSKPAGTPFGYHDGLYVWPKAGPEHLDTLSQYVLTAIRDITLQPADEPALAPLSPVPGPVISPRR